MTTQGRYKVVLPDAAETRPWRMVRRRGAAAAAVNSTSAIPGAVQKAVQPLEHLSPLLRAALQEPEHRGSDDHLFHVPCPLG